MHLKVIFLLIIVYNHAYGQHSDKLAPEDWKVLQEFEKLYSPGKRLANTSLRSNLEYATLLFKRNNNGDSDKANHILKNVISYQNTAGNSLFFGQWPLNAGEVARDQNAALLMARLFFVELWPHISKMTPEVAELFKQSARRLVKAAERRWDEESFDLHRDYVAYTNVFIMYINALQLGGKFLPDDRIWNKAEAQWKRWFNRVSLYGFDEFNSQGYYEINFENLLDILNHSRSGTIKNQVSLILDFLVKQQYAFTHPILKMQVIGSSRDYRQFRTQGSNESNIIKQEVREYQKPKPILEEYTNRAFPYKASGRSTPAPFLFKSYQTQNGGLGTMTGGNYFWQQIHCMIAVGNSETEREVVFIPGSYTPINGFSHQKDNTALCIFYTGPNTYYRTQTMQNDKEIISSFGSFGIGITNGWEEVENNQHHLVLQAYDHEVHVYPFSLKKGKIEPAVLTYEKRNKSSEIPHFHQTKSNFGEYLFPNDVFWVGCWITYVKKGAKVKRPVITFSSTSEIYTFRSDNDLAVKLFRQPSGELTELYQDDWRATPLLKTPLDEIWPGKFNDLMLNSR